MAKETLFPVPYAGGKNGAAGLVWAGLKDCNSYIEPCCGTAAVFWCRPKRLAFETLNDADGFVVNFLRAVQREPLTVAAFVDLPRAELELRAVSAWLLKQDLKRQLAADKDFYSAEAAGLWAWYSSVSIGDGVRSTEKQQPRMIRQGVLGTKRRESLPANLLVLQDLLQDVRILCGDWQACLGKANHQDNWKTDPVGVFFDPPYLSFENYNEGKRGIARNIEYWCREHENDPAWRIVLAGYAGDYNLPGWIEVPWQTQGRVSRTKSEMLWMCPLC